VYPFAPPASRHAATTRCDDVGTCIIEQERSRCARSASDSRNLCEMGISSMSENACTTPADRLDSVFGDAADASHDIAAADFCRKKICAQTFERAISEDVRHAHGSEKRANRSPPIRRVDRFEHSGKPVDTVDSTSIAPIPDRRNPARAIARGTSDHLSRRSTCARRARRACQRPSFALRRSLTACGFALPPDNFMIWPTNQPTSAGFC
jgi:hypothetical protein